MRINAIQGQEVKQYKSEHIIEKFISSSIRILVYVVFKGNSYIYSFKELEIQIEYSVVDCLDQLA